MPNSRSSNLKWRELAECKDVPPSIFYDRESREDILRAKSYCEKCEVRIACLDHALEVGEKHGVWGGLTEDERENLQQRVAFRGLAR
jgi:WhiB family redox-sensing transcriptional regulator